mmetsp:Transcript_121443/g.303072  ORF Transcript_121443/g.303072 Transcript_121443/m.303072 type:complete len:306 (-) Transcript_121443:142-1059(-)
MAVEPAPLLAEHRKKSWRDFYTDEELSHGRHIKLRGALGVPLFIAWYFALAALLGGLSTALWGSEASGSRGEAHHELASTPAAILVLQAILAALAVFAFVLQSALLPNNANEDIYYAQTHIGAWIFLTRHCLMLQVVHQVASLFVGLLMSAYLASTTNCISLWMGGLGWFVTIQYFTLVHFNPVFMETCAEKAARDPPYDLRTRCIWMHSFALPIAVLDIAIARQHGPLRADSSIVASLLMVVFYVLFYIGLIVANFRVTGYWPYEFLKEFKTVGKWISFAVAQSAIMTIFCLISWGLALVPSAW